jgi:auxin efflux carrier family protein
LHICRWYIPVNIVVGAVSGSLIGFVVASIIRPPYPYFKFTVIHIGIGTASLSRFFFISHCNLCPTPRHALIFYAGNIGNIPLVLIAALCRDPSNPFGDSDKCNQDGNAYISFGQWVCLVFSFLESSMFMF